MFFHRIVKSNDWKVRKNHMEPVMQIWSNSFDSNVKKICRTLGLNCEPSFIEICFLTAYVSGGVFPSPFCKTFSEKSGI